MYALHAPSWFWRRRALGPVAGVQQDRVWAARTRRTDSNHCSLPFCFGVPLLIPEFVLNSVLSSKQPKSLARLLEFENERLKLAYNVGASLRKIAGDLVSRG
jgi:hypothetical protein